MRQIDTEIILKIFLEQSVGSMKTATQIVWETKLGLFQAKNEKMVLRHLSYRFHASKKLRKLKMCMFNII